MVFLISCIYKVVRGNKYPVSFLCFFIICKHAIYSTKPSCLSDTASDAIGIAWVHRSEREDGGEPG